MGTEQQGDSSNESEERTSGSEGDENSDNEGGRDETGDVSGRATALDQTERRRDQGKGSHAPGVTQAETGRAQGEGGSPSTTTSRRLGSHGNSHSLGRQYSSSLYQSLRLSFSQKLQELCEILKNLSDSQERIDSKNISKTGK